MVGADFLVSIRLLWTSVGWHGLESTAILQIVSFSSPPLIKIFSGNLYKTLLQCGQLGSYKSTQDHRLHNETPSIHNIFSTSTVNSKFLFLTSFLFANDSSRWNTVPSVLKPLSKLHIRAFNLRTLYQTGQQTSLVTTLESRDIDLCLVFEARVQNPSMVVHLISSNQYVEPTWCTLRLSSDLIATPHHLTSVCLTLIMKASTSWMNLCL